MKEVILLQNTLSRETRLMSIHAATASPPPRIVRCSYESLERTLTTTLASVDVKDILPVGSVEFIKKVMQICGVFEPTGLSYIPPIDQFLGRNVELMPKGQFLKKFCNRDGVPVKPWFVKPYETNKFYGFVLKPENYEGVVDGFLNFVTFTSMADNELIWVSEVVEFIAEWQVYVLKDAGGHYEVLSVGRYGDEEGDIADVIAYPVVAYKGDLAYPVNKEYGRKDDLAYPVNKEYGRKDDLAKMRRGDLGLGGFVFKVLDACETLNHSNVDLPVSFALDVGLCSDGEFRVVGVKDAWTVRAEDGIAGGDYYRFLVARWDELC